MTGNRYNLLLRDLTKKQYNLSEYEKIKCYLENQQTVLQTDLDKLKQSLNFQRNIIYDISLEIKEIQREIFKLNNTEQSEKDDINVSNGSTS